MAKATFLGCALFISSLVLFQYISVFVQHSTRLLRSLFTLSSNMVLTSADRTWPFDRVWIGVFIGYSSSICDFLFTKQFLRFYTVHSHNISSVYLIFDSSIQHYNQQLYIVWYCATSSFLFCDSASAVFVLLQFIYCNFQVCSCCAISSADKYRSGILVSKNIHKFTLSKVHYKAHFLLRKGRWISRLVIFKPKLVFALKHSNTRLYAIHAKKTTLYIEFLRWSHSTSFNIDLHEF